MSPVPIGETFGSPWGRSAGIGELISIVLSGGLLIASIIVVILFVVSGLLFIQGAGSGDPKTAAQGKLALTWAVTGFVIVFAAYWIVFFIMTVFKLPFIIQL